MAIKVFIERSVVPGGETTLNELLIKLRSKAIHAKGYISGETLHSLDDPYKYLVISTWNNLDERKGWEADRERQKIQDEIDSLLNTPSTQRVFLYGQ